MACEPCLLSLLPNDLGECFGERNISNGKLSKGSGVKFRRLVPMTRRRAKKEREGRKVEGEFFDPTRI